MLVRPVAVLTVLLLATACSSAGGTSSSSAPSAAGGKTERARPTATRPTSAGGPDDGRAVIVAVSRSSGALELRRVGAATSEATLVRALTPPVSGARVVDLTLTAGAEPLVCASWHLGPGEVYDDLKTALVCYPPGAAGGREVRGVERPSEVALSADGSRIAWSLATTGEQNPVFSTAELRDGKVSAVERRRGLASQPDDAFTGNDVQDLAWSDDRHLVVSTAVQSDDDPRLLHVDVDVAPRRGWLEDGRVVPGPPGPPGDGRVVPGPPGPPGYRTFDSVRSAGAGTALARERGYDLADDGPPDRAVRVDLRTGRLLEVLATTAKGRLLVGVSGTPDAVVYVTAATVSGPKDVKAYLRLRGQPRGTPISGLPADTQDVLAQR